MRRLEIFWDVGSPYTHLAITQLPGLRERTRAELVLRPFLLGGVFKAVENRMPASIVPKAAYMQKDLARWRDRYGLNMKIPPNEVIFPINSLIPMRVAAAIDDPIESERYCHALMNAYWSDGIDVGTADNVRALLDHHAFDGEALLNATARQEIKDRLRQNTEEAVARGAFGAPTMFVGDEMFWGNDRLDFVEAALCAR